MRLVHYSMSIIALCCAAPVDAQDNLFAALEECYAHNAVVLEPHQNNMLDLSELIFESTCDQEKSAFFNSIKDLEEKQMHFSMVPFVVQSKVLAARATRLGIAVK